MQTKENYLLTIFKEHQKEPYVIWRLSGCGGCIEIEKRLYACMEKDLQIICNLNTYKKTGGRDISNHPKGHKMLLNMCEKINTLEWFDVDSMSRVYFGTRFYETNTNHDNFLKFMIMYVWDNLNVLSEQHRGDKLKFLKNMITNKPVLGAIESMEKHYKKNFLNNPALMKSYI